MKKIVAKALIGDASGKLLLLYRGLTHPNFPGHLDLPGGEVEENEQWENAVARELLEETALSVPAKSLIKVLEKSYPDVTHVLYTSTLPSLTPDVTLSWEHSDHKWWDRAKLVDDPLPQGVDLYYLDVLEYLKSLR